MYLVYTDETGTNFSEKSPYLLYGGLVVHESKVNILELQLVKMIAKFLKLDDIKEVELHTSEIFHILFSENFDCQNKKKQKDKDYCEHLKVILANVTADDFINFVNELIQFLTKMNISLMVSIVNKTDEIHSKHRLNKEVSSMAYSFKIFLNILDRFLASKNENALLIVDDFRDQMSNDIKKLSLYERIKDENIKTKKGAVKELVFLRVIHESMSWKTGKSLEYENIAPLKYEFESQNMFLVDNINYTNSKDSILNQVADFILFILRKVLEVNNSDEQIYNDNVMKLVKNIDESLKFAMGNGDLILVKLYNNDISLTNSVLSNRKDSFKELCQYI